MDALQYAAAVFHPQHWRVVIDWTGDIPASGWRMTGQIPINGDIRPNNPGSRRGMLAPWRVDAAQLAEITRLQVDRVIQATLISEQREHQSMIRRAVRAFADGERQRSMDGKKMSYITVFDIFFSVRDTEDTTRSIREGVAFAMFLDTSPELRFEQAQFINRLYDSRSRTTHDFELGVNSDDLRRLRMIAYNFIGVMARREAFTKASLRSEIDAQREAMGADYDRFKHLGRSCEDPDREVPPVLAPNPPYEPADDVQPRGP